MTNPILKAGQLAGKIAVREALDVGKEAYAESRETHTPLKNEFIRQARERAEALRDEARAVVAYLKMRPARAAVLIVSAVTAAVAVALLRSRRAS